MLVNFSVKNYRSFYNEVNLSLEASANKEFAELNTFQVDKGLLGNQNELLKSAIVYGANASGKSNLIKALRFMKAMVENSIVVDPRQSKIVDLNEPFCLYDFSVNEPTAFSIGFILQNKVYYEYGFIIKNNQIIEEHLSKRIERLTPIFKRVNNMISFGKDEVVFDNSKSLYLTYICVMLNMPINATLTNIPIQDFRNVMSWFKTLEIIDDKRSNWYDCYDDYHNQALAILKRADIGIRDFQIERTEFPNGDVNIQYPIKPSLDPQMFPQIKPDIEKKLNVMLDIITSLDIRDKTNKIINKKPIYLNRDSWFHSMGTHRLFSFLGLMLKILDKGGVIVVDEIDSNLHFLVADVLIKMFNSIDKNNANAQLVCTAHNPLLMDEALRRDQVYFTFKEENGNSQLYSLDAIQGVRERDFFSKKYLAGFYSAIPNIKGDK